MKLELEWDFVQKDAWAEMTRAQPSMPPGEEHLVV